MYINSGNIFENAVQACVELRSPATMPAQKITRESLSGILLAVLSAEAFINELPQIAEGWLSAPDAGEQPKPGWIGALNSILVDAEKSRASIQTKFMFAKFILTGATFDRGASTFQQFELLIDVRNFVVHARPKVAVLERVDKTDEYRWSEPNFIARLRESKIISDTQERETLTRLRAGSLQTDVTSLIFRGEIAVWACRTVRNLVIELLDAIPAPQNAITNLIYRKAFSIPEDFE